jgi:HEAT repeat protein
MPQRGRRNADQLVLMALACGATVENAALSAGISQATVYRRLKDPEFLWELRKIKTEMVGRTASMLTAAGGEAVKTLLALLKDPTPPAVRLGAARALLELGTRLRESAELHERVDAMEKQLAAEAAAKTAGESPGQYRVAG